MKSLLPDTARATTAIDGKELEQILRWSLQNLWKNQQSASVETAVSERALLTTINDL